VVVESLGLATPGLAERVRDALRDVLLVGPAVQIVPAGSLERTAFKAKRVVDRRRSDEGGPPPAAARDIS
jgi:phenylacetate-coenzyme A ligase PaaK-like adenylate-forming protein